MIVVLKLRGKDGDKDVAFKNHTSVQTPFGTRQVRDLRTGDLMVFGGETVEVVSRSERQ